MSAVVMLIVGLGNPGPEHQDTRHNAGFWFVEQLAQQYGQPFRLESKFHGELCRVSVNGQQVWLLKPNTFMNRSGQSIMAVANFYKIPLDNILVVHDELDLQAGVARLKQGGGHGGHNGLRDTIAQLGSKEFMRLRLGIDHPGNSGDVSNYVLARPSKSDQLEIDRAIDDALAVMPQLISGEVQKAMHQLHSE